MNKSYFYLEMKTHELKVPYTGKLRRVRVLLPKNYETDTNRRYPVVYFHDGQNILYSKEAYAGHSWKVIPTIKRNPDISRMIVVAIDNDGFQRMNEYSAWKYKESIFLECNLVARALSTESSLWKWSNLSLTKNTGLLLTENIQP